MAMLAGPRQRKRYNLVPKGKALFEDGDRFGTKMLEKMGWSKGKGLGSKENGQQEFIRIRYKNDANGLGYEDRDDQWTEHEKHFNGLLESLHAGESNSNTASGDDGDDCAPRIGFGFEKSKTDKEKLKDKFSGQSLEERSKKSKARVHYKKFTKGKDMTQYSEKDLANIFGKKATADENDFYSQLPSFNAGNEATDDGEKKQEFELGTHTVNTGLSVADYFKMKMEALKNKRGAVEKKEDPEASGDGQDDIVEVIDIANEGDDEGNRKKKKKSKKQNLEDVPEKENGFEEVPEETTLNGQQMEVCENAEEEPVVLKSKKKKSKKAPLGDTVSDCVEVVTLDDEPAEEQRPKKKKKKSADDSVLDEVTEETGVLKESESNPQADESITAIPSKKKKSKKIATEIEATAEVEVDSEQVSTDSVADEVPQESKRNKKRKAEESAESVSSLANDQLDSPSKKKTQADESITTIPSKKKKSKKIATETEASAEVEVDSEQVSTDSVADEVPQESKKNKKRKAEESAESMALLANDQLDSPSKKKTIGSPKEDPLSVVPQPEPTEKINKQQTVPASKSTPIKSISKRSQKKIKKKSRATADAVTVSSPNDLSSLTDCLDTYTISTFCAEKFRNVDLGSFKGSNLSEQNGYGLSENLKLNIINMARDQDRITQLWSGRVNKYKLEAPKGVIYHQYMGKVIRARREHKRIPKMKVKPLHRRSAFQSL